VRLYQQLFVNARFYAGLAGLVFLFLNAFWLPVLYPIAVGGALLFTLWVVLEALWLFKKPALVGERLCAEKFSNGDANQVQLTLENRYGARLKVEVIDELPEQLQIRNQVFNLSLEPGQVKHITYTVRPLKRGPYAFGYLQAFASGWLHLLKRRYSLGQPKEVAVYPSFVQMRHYELLAISNKLVTAGIKKIRRAGHNREFEQIDPYVKGDDYRKINWKATARKNQLMVNHYQDERSQNVVMALDKGRSMKMPFAGMSLLDYAINSSLIISNIALRKGDRAGLVTFQDTINGQVLPANRASQLPILMEALYRQKTSYKESSIKQLYTWLGYRVSQRSLVILYTNFESVHSLRRQLPYLKLINRNHLLLVVFFKNTEVEALSQQAAQGLEAIYTKGLAESLLLEKRQMAQELEQLGIHTLLTAPGDLNVKTLNHYLELKARGLL
jgi:uncharacterized protein (DUF58 family)